MPRQHLLSGTAGTCDHYRSLGSGYLPGHFQKSLRPGFPVHRLSFVRHLKRHITADLIQQHLGSKGLGQIIHRAVPHGLHRAVDIGIGRCKSQLKNVDFRQSQNAV